jgi:hypothetical protein
MKSPPHSIHQTQQVEEHFPELSLKKCQFGCSARTQISLRAPTKEKSATGQEEDFFSSWSWS